MCDAATTIASLPACPYSCPCTAAGESSAFPDVTPDGLVLEQSAVGPGTDTEAALMLLPGMPFLWV